MTAEPLGYALGIDVGATKIAGGVVELASGRVAARRVVSTAPGRGPQAVMQDLATLAAELRAAVPPDQPCHGVGVGVPELVSPDGAITSAYLMEWPAPARALFDAPLRFEADVRAHARAEARYGAGRALGLFVYVSVGSGISACLVQDGRPLVGARGNALVLASGPLSLPCPECGALAPFVLEEYASGLALAARYNQQGGRPVARAEELLVYADAGDLVAQEVLRTAGLALGSAVAWLINMLDPEAVIIGGGLGLADGLYWQSFSAAVRAHIWAAAARDLPLMRAALGADAGIVGAALALVEQGATSRH